MKQIFPLLGLMLTLISCHHDTPELGFDFRKIDNGGIRFIAYRERDCDVEEEQPWTRLPETVEFDSMGNVMNRKARMASSLVPTDLARGILGSLTSYKVHQVCGTYRTIDVNGDSITLSGAVFYPTQVPIKNIIVCSHFTVAANYEVPSESFPIEATMASFGYMVVMTDYIGYGLTQNMIHPYLKAEVTAHNVLDMALGVYSFISERGLTVQSPEVILAGYSQGGAASMWVQYYIETKDYYKTKFTIKKNYCGGGPYDIARTYDYCVKLDETGIPYAVPMIILGMSEGMSEPLNMSTFFQEPLLSNYAEWFYSKKYNGVQITRMIGVNRLSLILTSAGLDRKNGETLRLYRELQANSLPPNYRPKAPVYMFHSMDDQTVPFINAQVTRYNFDYGADVAAWFEDKPNVEYDFGHYGNHEIGCLRFYLKVFDALR